MVQEFTQDDTLITLVSDTFKNTLKRNSDALNKMFNGAYTDKFLGVCLAESNAIDLAELFDKNFIAENYNAIILAYEQLGTYPSYITVIKALFGENVVIDFENPTPGVLNINISNIEADFDNLVTKDDDNLVTKDGDNLIAKDIFPTLSNEAGLKFLNSFVPSGVVVNFFIGA